MAIIKSTKKHLLELRRENTALRLREEKQAEMLEFLGVLNDVDIEEMMSGDTEEVPDNG